MGQIEIGLSPVVGQLGPVTLRWYGLAIALAIVVAVALTRRELARAHLRLQPFDLIVLGTVAGGVLGARLLHVVDRWEQYAAQPARILALQEGGLAIYGAVLGGFVAVALLSRIYHFPFLPVIDAIAPGLLLAQAIGRLGCVVNGDAWGTATTWPIAFVYTNPAAMLPRELLDVPTHPYPLYDLGLNLAVFALIWRAHRWSLPAGARFALFVALYGLGRFAISSVRQERVILLGLQEAQLVALAAVVCATGALVWLRHRSNNTSTDRGTASAAV